MVISNEAPNSIPVVFGRDTVICWLFRHARCWRLYPGITRLSHIHVNCQRGLFTDGQLVGFDFASLPQYGFFGPLHQVNPAGQPTIFQMLEIGFPYYGVREQDSYFKFFESNLSVPPGFSSESSTHLRSVFASPTSLGTSVPFVQLVISDSAIEPVRYNGSLIVVGLPWFDCPVSGTIRIIPEPTGIALFSIAAVMLGGSRYRRRRV